MLAYLVCKIEFKGLNNEQVVLNEHTIVYVDHTEGIAYVNGIHFDIQKHEYVVAH